MPLAVRVVARIDRLAARTHPIERRDGKIEMTVAYELRQFLKEEGDEERGDVSAVDIGIRHHDHALIAQLVLAVLVPQRDAERLDEVGELLVLRELVASRARRVEDLAAQGKDGLRRAVAGLLGAAASRIALDDEDLRPGLRLLRAIGELAGQPELPDRALAVDLALLAPAALALLSAVDDPVEQLLRLGGRCRRANGRTDRGLSAQRCAPLRSWRACPWSAPGTPAHG